MRCGRRRNPRAFLEALLERFLATVLSCTPGVDLGSPSKTPLCASKAATGEELPEALATLLSAAAVALLQHHVALGDHAAALGYVGKLLRLLAAR